MRKMSFLVASGAMILASSPSLAAPCPISREEGQKFLAALPKLGTEHCSYPCSSAVKHDATGLKIFGVQPIAVVEQTQMKRLSSVIFVLPGALSTHTGAYKKAFPSGKCGYYGGSCEASMGKAPEGALRQVLLNSGMGPTETRLLCNFEYMD